MTKNDLRAVKDLCRVVAGLCVKIEKDFPEKPVNESFFGSPETAGLKRRSMDLTRALARLRGRGRF